MYDLSSETGKEAIVSNLLWAVVLNITYTVFVLTFLPFIPKHKCKQLLNPLGQKKTTLYLQKPRGWFRFVQGGISKKDMPARY